MVGWKGPGAMGNEAAERAAGSVPTAKIKMVSALFIKEEVITGGELGQPSLRGAGRVSGW